MRTLHCNTAVIGAGAAGLNAADELKRLGVDALLLCDDFKAGTSRNAGSDKQTYYKLGMSGAGAESVREMAESFYAGGGMHGDIAYAMAALSARSFMKLALLGVPFPHNEWGEFVGYQTDHDLTQRATSAGPLTSKMMAEALAESVKDRGVRREDGLSLLSILTDGENRAVGALMHDGKDFVLVNARNIVLCTGGAALAYGRVVFPASQRGASGAAIRAGAATNNLCYWQYGLASVKVRWNVSGSYQQAVPSYTDGRGEFLLPFFKDRGDMLDSVFLKGYQWPFDARKMAGSSRVDMAVAALNADGGHAYMDFTREPEGGALSGLGAEALTYLENCGALQNTPIGRLAAINQKAVDFYASHGIDLHREPLEVAVCAQHSNGGLLIDRWWRTTVEGLYAAGECAGAFGMYRPGGSALNETQVGSLRAAMHIAAHTGKEPARGDEEFEALADRDLRGELAFFTRAGEKGRADALLRALRADMDAFAGAMRDAEKMKEMRARVTALLAEGIPGETPEKTAELRDTLLVQRDALSAMLCQAEYAGEAGHGFTAREVSKDAPDARLFAFETRGGETRAVPLRPLPEGGGWFEAVWRRYLNGEVYD
ncbi:MAG: FAD-binding protein [Clostridia bacterium]|nr:FAD-binding protein [Clostridia bacterium]